MIAIDNNMPAYRGSRGHGKFVLPSGQVAVVCADDAKITAELRRRGRWTDVESSIRLGNSFACAERTSAGMDFFLWFGMQEDGGFIWYAFPGAKPETPDVLQFWRFVTTQILGSPVPLVLQETRNGPA